MPVDSRRLQGPDNTFPYHLYVEKQSTTHSQWLNQIINSNNLRKDGRKLDDIRKVFLKTSVLSQAKGSAYIEVGRTKVICSAFDPREIPNHNKFSQNGELYCDFKFANFSQKKRRGFIRDAEEKDLSVSLKRALEPAVCRHEFPNFQVDVYALVLEDDGAALAAAITCASLALADASIPMYDLVTALALGIHGEYKFLDPTEEEESLCCQIPPGQNKNHGLIVLAYATQLQQVTQLTQVGVMDSECLIEASNTLSSHCSQTHQQSQQCLAQVVLKLNKEKKRLLELGETFKNMDVSSEKNNENKFL